MTTEEIRSLMILSIYC